jgi:hypothetical protein
VVTARDRDIEPTPGRVAVWQREGRSEQWQRLVWRLYGADAVDDHALSVTDAERLADAALDELTSPSVPVGGVDTPTSARAQAIFDSLPAAGPDCASAGGRCIEPDTHPEHGPRHNHVSSGVYGNCPGCGTEIRAGTATPADPDEIEAGERQVRRMVKTNARDVAALGSDFRSPLAAFLAEYDRRGAALAGGVTELLERCDVEDRVAGEYGWIQTTEVRALLTEGDHK